MKDLYIYLILGSLALLISYKLGLLSWLYNKLIQAQKKVDNFSKEYNRQSKIQSKANKKYNSYFRNRNDEI